MDVLLLKLMEIKTEILTIKTILLSNFCLLIILWLLWWANVAINVAHVKHVDHQFQDLSNKITQINSRKVGGNH